MRDEKGTVFNIEMQATDSQENLQKRTRYYQGLIDIDLIDKGAAYDELNPTYIIFICTFDPFGSNRNMYTFRNVCIEDSTLELNDEATKIFLNSKGDSGDVSPDIKAFLQYVEGVLTENTFVQEINSEVAHVKNNKEWRREFMTFEMELKRMEQKGIKQGIEQGTVEKARCMALKMLQDNCPVEIIAKYTELSEDEIKRLAEELV